MRGALLGANHGWRESLRNLLYSAPSFVPALVLLVIVCRSIGYAHRTRRRRLRQLDYFEQCKGALGFINNAR